MHSSKLNLLGRLLEYEFEPPALRAFWARGRLWVAPGSPYNSNGKRPIPLLNCYANPVPLPPLPDAVDRLIESLWETIPRAEGETFSVEATILRATAKDYHRYAA
jgi:hypothetical protein